MHRSLSRVIPLLLPDPGGKLLVFGWHSRFGTLNLEGWDHVEAVGVKDPPPGIGSSARSANGAGRARAALIIGRRGLLQYRGDDATGRLPIAMIGRGSIPRSLCSDDIGLLRRSSLPLWGRPLVWISPRDLHWLHDVSPRGRFDRYVLSLQSRVEFLRRLGIGYSLLADRWHSVIGRLLARGNVLQGTWQHTRTGMVVVLGQHTVLKIALHGKAAAALKRNNASLDSIRTMFKGKSIEELVPKRLGYITEGGYTASIESRLPGRSAFRLVSNEDALYRLYHAATAVLEEWYDLPVQSYVVDSEAFAERWVVPLSSLKQALYDHGDGELWDRVETIAMRRLMGRQMVDVPQHGDFWLNNMLTDPTGHRVSGLVDWELAAKSGLPLLDVFHMLTWRTHFFLRDFSPRKLIAGLPAKNSSIDKLVRKHCSNIGIDESVVADLYVRYWLGQIAARSAELFPSGRTVRLIRAIEALLRECPAPS